MKIPLSQIKPSPRPVRTSWDEAKLNELAQSIQEQGLIVPVKVRPVYYFCEVCRDWFPVPVKHCPACDHHYPDAECGNCHKPLGNVKAAKPATQAPPQSDGALFELVYGHRRIEAARRAGLQEVECIVEGVDDTAALVQAATENMAREDMEPLDKARVLGDLKHETGWSTEKVAAAIGINRRIADNYLSLLRLPEDVAAQISSGAEHNAPELRERPLTLRHVIDAAPAGDDHQRATVLRKAADENLSSAQTRRVAESIAAAPSEEAKRRLLEWEYSPTIHDPELIRSRAKDYGGNDPMYRESGPSQQQRQWDETPEVAGLIQALKSFTAVLEQVTSMMQIGKLAPEARRFLANRYRQVAKQLNNKAEELERDGNEI